jgi:hypothetical protein
MNIRRFEKRDYQSLIDFNIQTYPERDNIEESILYRFFYNPFSVDAKSESIIVTDEQENIIGQILMMPSEFNYKGDIFPVFWGMDYFVNKENRRNFSGITLANMAKDVKHHFGIGFTKVSLGIFLALKEKVVGYMTKYIRFNTLYPFLFNNLIDSIKYKKEYQFPIQINIQGGKFIKASNSNEIQSDDGFWNKNLIEFSRINSFLDWRFFYYPDKYYVYRYTSEINEQKHEKKTPYFVVRPIIWKNVDCLLLVDYRYETSDIRMLNRIIDSVVKLSKSLGMAATITGCSIGTCEVLLKKKWFLKFGTKLEIVTKFSCDILDHRMVKDKIFVTFADSDCDFFYFDQRW